MLFIKLKQAATPQPTAHLKINKTPMKKAASTTIEETQAMVEGDSQPANKYGVHKNTLQALSVVIALASPQLATDFENLYK